MKFATSRLLCGLITATSVVDAAITLDLTSAGSFILHAHASVSTTDLS